MADGNGHSVDNPAPHTSILLILASLPGRVCPSCGTQGLFASSLAPGYACCNCSFRVTDRDIDEMVAAVKPVMTQHLQAFETWRRRLTPAAVAPAVQAGVTLVPMGSDIR